ncbi:MAG: beta-galactosidase [Terracidiphilus sp.]|nr:beta-galactosidase [Terracidiphilus sp.]
MMIFPLIAGPRRARRSRTVFPALLAAAALLLALAAPAPLCAQSPAPSSSLWLGAAWYPEQWPESQWDRDLSLMEQAHINVVRIGEFAWSTMEPAEGRYDLDWLFRAVRLAEKHHIAIVLGTPTDAPPAWLTRAYPETLRTDASGRVAEHGGRRQFNYANPRYRELCAAIASQLAHRFGSDPNVIGWQIGNEFTDESFDPETRRQFQQWLERRYGSLDALNRAWATAYWSQTYDRWDEIPLPSAGGNPGLLLDHKRFVGDTWRSFQRVQIDAIRKFANARQFLTTNLGGLGWSDNFDHVLINEDLDLASWDDYVGQGHLNVARNAFMHDFVRGWKRKNFWVMETQPGSVNWAPVNNILNRGETRAVAWQSIGHGADAVLYWQWRDALNGQEQYHGAIAGPDGGPLPIYSEIAEEGSDFARTSAALANTAPSAQVALLHSYPSRWAIDFQPHNRNYDQLEVLFGYYRPLRAERLTVDVIDAAAPLGTYKVVFAPSLNVLSNSLAEHLRAYVEQGGHLVLGPRSGMKDDFNALNPQRQPGPLVPALGGRVEQYYALESSVPVAGSLGSGSASIWAEQLSATDPAAQVLLRYGKANGWLDNQPAILTRTLGRGSITYVGALLDPALMQRLIAWATETAGVKPEFAPLPADVELNRRVAPGRTVYILIRHGSEGPATESIPLPAPMRDLLHENKLVSSVSLASEDVAVLEKP